MKLYISPSKIAPAEKGLFAGSDLLKGTLLFVDFTRVANAKGVSFEMDYKPSMLSKLINSSENGNTICQSRGNNEKIMRIAARDIKTGEELTKNNSEIKKIILFLGYIFKVPL
ncbi:MAG: SET domain-containing protein [Bacteroidia bacterium]